MTRIDRLLCRLDVSFFVICISNSQWHHTC